MEINGIAHTFVTVADFDRARAFYSKLLPFLGLKNVMDIPGTYYCVGGRTGFAIREAGEILTPAGTADANVGVVPSVRLGSITIREVTVLSLDDRYSNDFQIDGRSGSVIGILGSDLLDHLGATIDYRSNRLLLRAP